MPSFYFEQLLQRGLNGIDQQGITAAVLQIAGIILILSLLWAIYEAYSNGGDVRQLGVAAVKYLVLGLVFLNYQSAFRAVNMMFNSVADGVYNLSGGMDVIHQWINSVSQAWSTNPNWYSAIFNFVTGGVSAILGGLISISGYILLPLTYTLFTLFYALYGSILYVVGPFVLALMPSRGLGQVGRTFFVNMMIFQCWGLLYAILQALMSALQITDPMQFTGSFLNAFSGASQVLVMSLASVLLAIMIAFIPFIASRIVRGDIGSTLMTVISGTMTAAAVASGVGAAIGGGVAAGRAATPQGPPTPPSGGPGPGGPPPGGAAQGTNPSPGATQQPGIANAVLAQSRPPTPPGSGESGGSAAGPSSSAGSAGADAAGGSSPTSAGSDEAPATGSGGAPAPTAPVLWNPKTGQVFSWGGSGWQAAGHVSSPAASSLIQQNGGQYGVTSWTGGDAGQASRGYTGKSLAGHAVWQAGHIVGRTMRLVGMGKA